MAPVGILSTYLSVDKPQISGCHDPLSGTISVTFKPSTPSPNELFGPLQMRVVLRGHMKLHVAENRTSHAYIFFDENRTLFRKPESVLDGPFKIVAGVPEYVRYQIKFPEKVEVIYHGIGPTIEHLPPSMKTRFEVRAPRQFGQHQGRAEITYNICVEAEMPGIDIEVVTEPKVPIQFNAASESMPTFEDPATEELSQTLRVGSYKLLPEDLRSSNLLTTTKAIFNRVPKPLVVFTATCARVPKVIMIGHPVSIDVRIKIDNEETTAPNIPDITLTGGSIDIIARTQLYATKVNGVDSPRLNHSDVVHSVNMTTQSPAGPFAKSNDHTKALRFEPLTSDVPSSFSMRKLERSYQARIELRCLVAGIQSVTMKKSVDIRIVSALNEQMLAPLYSLNGGEPSAVAGASRSYLEGVLGPEDHERLPLYEDAVGQAG